MTPTSRRLLGSLGAWVLVLAALRVSLLAPEACTPITADEARAAAVLSAQWIVDNQASDGEYLYQYLRDDARAVDDYNLVRHAGTTMSLYQLVEAGEDRFLPGADLGLAWMLERSYPTDSGPSAGLAFRDATSSARLGASALLLVSMAHRRAATGDTTHDDTMRAVGRFIAGQQRSDGSMLSDWSPRTSKPVEGVTSLYFTGEALWGLALLHREFPGEGWDALARPTLDYIATARDLDEDVFPAPWPDQWAAYSLQEMGDWGLSDDHIDYAERIAAQFGTMVRWEAQQTSTVATLWLGALLHGPEPSAAGQGTWLEGLGMLWELSLRDERLGHLQDDLEERLLCSAARLAGHQVTEARPGEDPTPVVGAWFTDGETRVDHQQHALSGLLFAERVLRHTPSGETDES
ncbi:MAG: hypothetical protein KDB21_20010 [Acidimicrobiales bacterium]|nr:hypothetical protein [Acidimicrobiales bacterium]